MAVKKRRYFTASSSERVASLLESYGYDLEEVDSMNEIDRLPVLANREPNRPGFSNPKAWLEEHKYASYVFVVIRRLHSNDIIQCMLVHGSLIATFDRTCIQHGLCHDGGGGQPQELSRKRERKIKPRGITQTSGAKITTMVVDDLEYLNESRKAMLEYTWYIFNGGIEKATGKIVVTAEKLAELSEAGKLTDTYVNNKVLTDYGAGFIEGDEVYTASRSLNRVI